MNRVMNMKLKSLTSVNKYQQIKVHTVGWTRSETCTNTNKNWFNKAGSNFIVPNFIRVSVSQNICQSTLEGGGRVM